jgi:hypothetical protein
MAEKNIIETMTSRPGQSQDDRSPPELDPHFVDVDERSAADLLSQARKLASKMRFYRDNPDDGAEGWDGFFPEGDDQALLAREDGKVPPHLGLFAAFLHLYRYPQQAINTITGRHLDFQFRDVLRFKPKQAQPDRAHLLLELKKGVSPLAITPEMAFLAGKDGSGAELLYRPVRETVVGHGKVEALHSVFHDTAGIYFAPIANSSDGLGDTLDAALPKWRAFGSADLPPAHIGFALSAPVLRMQEGVRTVTVVLGLIDRNLSEVTLNAFGAAFEANITSPDSWRKFTDLTASQHVDGLALSFTIPAASPPVVDYDPGIHGHAFATQAPVLQLLLKPEASLRYDDLKHLAVISAQITVKVDGLRKLALENDDGSLNPKKAFLPFGAQPVKGARFMIGCDEALSNHLLQLKISLTWQGAPDDLSDRYAGYENCGNLRDGIGAYLIYQDSSGKTSAVKQSLLACKNTGVSVLDPGVTPADSGKTPAPVSRLFALRFAGSGLARKLAHRIALAQPIHQRDIDVPPPGARSGYITIALIDDFLHGDYRKETIANALRGTSGLVLNEPYTPKVQSISLYYEAQSEKVSISGNDPDCFTTSGVQFFHVGCFGQRREHAYLRSQTDPNLDRSVPLLPDYPNEGEFLIGFSGAGAGDSLSVLIQVADGSADPDLEPQKVEWSVLCNNYWRALTPQELALDTSNNLRACGIVSIRLPQETSTEHTWMPTGRVWLRAGIKKNSAAACQLLSVAANAVEVRFADQCNDPGHLSAPLAAGSIARLKTPRAEVKSVSQPYASFGGNPQETDGMLTRRAAERLRHRHRCITAWDYERMLLEAFPSVHKVKCIPHSSEDSWLAPGHVMLVVVPDLRNQNAVDQLQPRVDIDTLVRMQDYAQQHAGMQVKIKVGNPHYQSVRLDFKVRFHNGYPFNHYRQELEQALIRALTPWAYDKSREIEFGGRIYRSVLLDFVEELPYVDFVSDFSMGLAGSGGVALHDVAEISADTPDTILVSNFTHVITEFLDA